MCHARQHRGQTLTLAVVATVACGGRLDGGAGHSLGSSDGHGGASSLPSSTAGDGSTTGGAATNAIGGGSASSDAGSTENGLQSFERRCPPDVLEPHTTCDPWPCEVFQPDIGEVATDCVFHANRVAMDPTNVNVFFDCVVQPWQTVDGLRQWTYFAERQASRVEFYAETCAAIRSRNMNVLDVAFGCPSGCIM
jgi:hypothetical protein